MQPRKQIILLFDDQCPMCTFQMRLLTWLDWLNRIELCPNSDPRCQTLAPHLTREALNAAIHCITPEGRMHRGARCLRHVGIRLPLLFPVALFLWVLGIIWIAEIAYKWVSRNRYILSKVFGCKEACSILPEREGRRHRDPETKVESSAP